MSLPVTTVVGDHTLSGSTPRTYIVFGCPRGGTTMVANMLVELGVDMGNNYPDNYEDPLFNYHVLSKRFDSHREIIQSIKDSIESIQGRKIIWGWKFPRASVYLQSIIASVRNPHLICVMRDPLAIAHRSIVHMAADPYSTLEWIMNLQTKNVKLMRQLALPSIFVSYERAINNPIQFIKELSSFLQISESADFEIAVQRITPGRYLKSKRQTN